MSKDTIEGTVVDGDGHPLANAEVSALAEDWEMGQPARAREKTDAAGRFRLTDLREEAYELEAIAADSRRMLGPSWQTELRSEPHPGVRPGAREVRLVILPRGAVVGTAAGAPKSESFSRVAIYLSPADREYSGSPFGALGGVVSVPCRVDGRRLVPDEPREGIRPTQRVVWGKSRGEDRTQDIVGALIETPYSFRVNDDQVAILEEGKFRVDGLRQGRWRLEVDDIRAMPDHLEFEVKAGRDSIVEFPVRCRGWLSAQVLGADGRPLQGASIVVLDAKGTVVPVLIQTVVLSRFGGLHTTATLLERFQGITTSRIDGGTNPRYLDPGSYSVRVMAEGCLPFSGTIEVAGGKSCDMEVRLDPER